MPEPCRKPPAHPQPAWKRKGCKARRRALAQAQALKLQARLEDLTVWQMSKVKQSRKGCKTYTYWMASWREGGKTRNVHLGSARKMDAEAALHEARKMKVDSLLLDLAFAWSTFEVQETSRPVFQERR